MEKILVFVDQEAGEMTALDKAVCLARTTGAKIELFSCCFNQALVASYPFDAKSREHAKHGFVHGSEKYLEELAALLLAQGVDVSTDVCWERSQEQGILRKVARYEPDLVVKQCRVHRRLGIHLHSHLDWQLIRDCPVPLLLTKGDTWQAPLSVVASVDPMHSHDKPANLDRHILQTAQELCRDLQGRLRVFHSFQPLPVSVIFDDTLVLDFDQFRHQLKLKHLQALEALLEPFGLSGADATLKEGEAHQELPEFAHEVSADLVVMGAVSRSSLDRLFLGTTAEKALDDLRCDLLIVKAQGFRGPPVEI